MGERRKLPQRVHGRAPTKKDFNAHSQLCLKFFARFMHFDPRGAPHTPLPPNLPAVLTEHGSVPGALVTSRENHPIPITSFVTTDGTRGLRSKSRPSSSRSGRVRQPLPYTDRLYISRSRLPVVTGSCFRRFHNFGVSANVRGFCTYCAGIA